MPSIASGRPTIPLETLTTRPQPRSSMSGTTARARLIGANTLIANADCNSPGSVLSVGPTGQTTAALLIRMSTPPSSPTTAAITCGTWSGSPRSAGATFATRPRARTSSAVSSSSSCERASNETFAPAWASATAVARPMPLPAPVTSACAPSNAVTRLPSEERSASVRAASPSDGHPAAVDRDDCPVQVARPVGCEEHDRLRDLLWSSGAAHWDRQDDRGEAVAHGVGPGRVGGAGRDGVDADAVRTVLGRPRLRQQRRGGLGGAVGRQAGHAELGDHRRDVDDAPMAAGRHPRRDRRRQQKRRLDIDRERLVEGRLGELMRGAARKSAGVVDEDVDIGGTPGERTHLIGRCEVGTDELGAPALLLDRSDDLRATLLAPAGDHDVGALTCQSLRCRPPNPRRPAGDKRALPFEVVHTFLSVMDCSVQSAPEANSTSSWGGTIYRRNYFSSAITGQLMTNSAERKPPKSAFAGPPATLSSTPEASRSGTSSRSVIRARSPLAIASSVHTAGWKSHSGL